MKVPTLIQLRAFIKKNRISGDWTYWSRIGSGTEIENYFSGNCAYASSALARMLKFPRYTITRGWYTRAEGIRKTDYTWIRNSEGHIAHSWLEYEGTIIDATWWQFHPGREARIYVFAPTNSEYYHYHTKDPR